MTITIIGHDPVATFLAHTLKEKGVCSGILEIAPTDLMQSSGSAEKAFLSDIMLLATTVNETLLLLPLVLDRIGDNTIVMDTGTSKQQICKAIKKHPRRKQFVSTCPVTTKTDDIIFDNQTVILCADDSALWVVERASHLYEALNMNLIFMKAEEHDLHMACLSHLPYIASFALATTIQEKEKNRSILSHFADAGFTPMVQLAQNSADTLAPAFDQNSKNISKMLGVYIRHLTKFKKNIDKKN